VVDGPPSAGRDARLRLAELEALWSRFAPGSDIDRLNRAAGAPVHVSRATITLLNTMVKAAEATSGRYDPTVLPALMDAGYRASIDDADRVSTLSPGPHRSGVGMADVVIDADAQTVTLPPDVAIDPGGIGKGLAADLVVEQLVLGGAAGALVSIGGDLATAGAVPRDARLGGGGGGSAPPRPCAGAPGRTLRGRGHVVHHQPPLDVARQEHPPRDRPPHGRPLGDRPGHGHRRCTSCLAGRGARHRRLARWQRPCAGLRTTSTAWRRWPSPRGPTLRHRWPRAHPYPPTKHCRGGLFHERPGVVVRRELRESSPGCC
jgi:hypothetical protein